MCSIVCPAVLSQILISCYPTNQSINANQILMKFYQKLPCKSFPTLTYALLFSSNLYKDSFHPTPKDIFSRQNLSILGDDRAITFVRNLYNNPRLKYFMFKEYLPFVQSTTWAIVVWIYVAGSVIWVLLPSIFYDLIKNM